MTNTTISVISVINEKGGVGKTTVTASLGGCYAKAGRRTLLIDMDPQASLTRGLIGSVETDQLHKEQTVVALFDPNFYGPIAPIQPTEFPNLSLLPGSRLLKPLNRIDPENYDERQFALRDLVNELDGTFDVVLIDGPPNLEFCAHAAMTAASWVLTPLQAEDYGAQGIRFVRDKVAEIQATTNPRLLLLGFLRTMFQKRAAIHLAYTETLRNTFPGLLFDNCVPYATHYREAIIKRTPISFYKPRVEAAKAIARIVDEIDARIAQMTAPPQTDNWKVAI